MDSEPNAALCQIEGPRFRQRPCAVPFFGKRDVPSRPAQASRLAGRRQRRPHIGTTGPLLLLSLNGLWRRRLGRNRFVSNRLGIFIHTAAVTSSLTDGRQPQVKFHPLPAAEIWGHAVRLREQRGNRHVVAVMIEQR